MSGQELELHQGAAPLAVSPIPSAAEWSLILQQANVVSRSGIVPANYRTVTRWDDEKGVELILQDRRPNVVVATLFGRVFGWDLMTSIRNIHVIEGAASMKPEAMLAMIRARGHRVSITREDRGVSVYGVRADTGDDYSARFTFEDGVRAGLCSLDENGWPRSRSDKGKVLPWEQYPVDMCQWRAVAQLARGLFGDIVLGAGYTPEEMGALVEADGSVVIDSAPMPTTGEWKQAPQAPSDSQGNETTTQEEPQQAQEAPAAAEPAPATPTPAEPARAQQEPDRELVAAHALDVAQHLRRNRNAARRGPAIRQASARAWDALVEAYPQWTKEDRVAEQVSELDKRFNTTPQTATTEQWTELAEEWERAADDAIRARHAGE